MSSPDNDTRAAVLSLFEALESVPDQQNCHGHRYPLAAVPAIAVSAMVSGARSLYAIAQWAREHHELVTSTLGSPRIGRRVMRRSSAFTPG